MLKKFNIEVKKGIDTIAVFHIEANDIGEAVDITRKALNKGIHFELHEGLGDICDIALDEHLDVLDENGNILISNSDLEKAMDKMEAEQLNSEDIDLPW